MGRCLDMVGSERVPVLEKARELVGKQTPSGLRPSPPPSKWEERTATGRNDGDALNAANSQFILPTSREGEMGEAQRGSERKASQVCQPHKGVLS